MTCRSLKTLSVVTRSDILMRTAQSADPQTRLHQGIRPSQSCSGAGLGPRLLALARCRACFACGVSELALTATAANLAVKKRKVRTV